MTIVNDESVFNDASNQSDWTAQDFDSPTDNDTNASPSIYREGAVCQQWILKENITGGYTFTSTLGGTKDISNGEIVIFWFFITADADLDKLTSFEMTLSSDTAFTTNNASWEASQQIYDLDYYGWFPVAVYPSNPDTTTGTIVYSSIDSIGWTASTGAAGTKLSGFDQCHSISYLGGHSQTVTLTDLYDDSISNDLGVALKFGDSFKFLVNIRTGGGTSTTLNLSNQSIFFDNIEPDHNLGFIGISDTGTNHFELSSCGITWNEQTGTSPEIFTTPANYDIFRIDSSTFARGGAFTCRSWISDANTFVTNTVINNCDRIDANNLLFENNTISNSRITAAANGAMLIDASFTSSRQRNNSFVRGSSSHGIVITVAGTYDLVGYKFTDYGADGTDTAAIRNESGGAVIINVSGGGDTPTFQNGTSATTTINFAVPILVQGVTEGTAIKVVADETVGTITEGDVLLEQLADSDGKALTSINYESAFIGSPLPTGLQVITRIRSSGLPTAAIQDDNGSYTDETTAANSAVAADMNLLPTIPVVNQDRYLFGHPEKYGKLKIEINTPGTGGFTITWQYWNGSTWANLADVVDGTDSFSNSGVNYVEFTIPVDWATTTINSQGPYYYIRAAYTAGTVTQVPLGTRCSLDVTKYLPFVQSGTVSILGLIVTATWVEDTIAKFKP